jgi:hypothetical protein
MIYATQASGHFAAGRIMLRKAIMKDVKVDVRVNVDVDTASVVLLLASASFALFLYKQNKREALAARAGHSPGLPADAPG